MAPGSVSPLAVEVAKNQWAGFHLAAADVHQHLPGTADGEDGEDLPRPGARGEEPEGIARINQAAALEIPAGGQRRPPRRLGCGGRSDSAAAHHPVEAVAGNIEQARVRVRYPQAAFFNAVAEDHGVQSHSNSYRCRAVTQIRRWGSILFTNSLNDVASSSLLACQKCSDRKSTRLNSS